MAINTRTNLIYQNFGVFVGPPDATGLPQGAAQMQELRNLQSVSFDYDRPLENVGRYGKLSTEKISTDAPTVSLSFEYNTVDIFNEQALGFTLNENSVISEIIQGINDNRNYFIGQTPPGIDFQGSSPADFKVIGFGNGFISSWSTTASVGSFVTTSVTVDCANIAAYEDGVAENLPAINETTGEVASGTFTLPTATTGFSNQPIALQQGDIELTFPAGASLFQDVTDMCVQSFSLDMDLSRTPLQCLGSRYSTSKLLDFPIDVTFSVDVLPKDLTTGNLANVVCDTSTNYDFVLKLYRPTCDTAGSRELMAQYDMKSFTLQNESFSSSYGSDATVTINWVGSIAASGDTTIGLFISGVSGYSGNGGFIYS